MRIFNITKGAFTILAELRKEDAEKHAALIKQFSGLIANVPFDPLYAGEPRVKVDFLSLEDFIDFMKEWLYA